MVNKIAVAKLSRMSGKPIKLVARKVVKYGTWNDGFYEFDKNKRIPFEPWDYWFESFLSQFEEDVIEVF